jgi:myo-inositol-1(or 4)-monophosphatase
MQSQYLKLTIQTAKEAGQILRDGFGTIFKISSKEGKNNLVTEYDVRAEKYIIGKIKEKYPDHTFLAEESGADSAESSRRWIIDPLDGTVNFAHNLPIFSVSIALEIDGEIHCGCVYNPIINEIFWAESGKGAFFNGEKIKVSEVSDFERAFLVTGFPYNVSENPNQCINHFVKVIGEGIPVRRLGSAAIDLCYTACGRFDGFWEIALHPWDVAAGMLILREAGGRMTHYDGSDYSFAQTSVIASNGLIHKNIQEVLKIK